MRRAAALAGLTLAVLALSPSWALARETKTHLDVSSETGTVSGEPVEVQARLLDASGRPVGGALVRLLTAVTFMGREQEAVMWEARTDGSGTAVLVFSPVEAGQVDVVARFDGAPGYAPASAGLTFQVVEPVVAYSPEPVGLQVWWARSHFILVPLVGIWLAYAVALSQVRKIRREGVRSARVG